MEEVEEDMEIIVNRIVNEDIPDAVTLPVVRHHTQKDKVLRLIAEDVKKDG